MPKPTYKELLQKVQRLEADLLAVSRQERDQDIGDLTWRWQATFNAVGAAICVLDRDWRILQCNKATEKLLQRPTGQIIGRKCFEMVHGTSRPPEECPVMRLTATKTRQIEVLRLYDRWVEIAVDPILDDQGDLKAIVHIITDITERKAAAESLRLREKTLSSIFKAAPTGIGMVVHRVITQANDLLCQMTGYSQQELTGQSARLLYATDGDYEYVGREKYRQIAAHGTGSVETRWRRKTGEIIDVLLSSTPLNPNDLSEGVTFTALDITGRKKDQMELKAFAEVFKEIPSGLFLYDYVAPERLILFGCNPAAEKLTGLKIGDWTGKEFNEIWPEARQRGITASFLKAMHTGEPYYTEDLYYQDNRMHGAFKIVAFPISGSRFCVAYEDITERMRFENELLVFKSAVEASADAIGMATPQGKHWYQNKAFDELFGNIGEDPSAVYANPSVAQELFQIITAGGSWTGEAEMKGRKGDVLQILLRAYAVKDTRGQVVNLVGVHTDITELKRYESKLRESEQRFRSLAELLPQTVFEMELSGRLIFANKNALNTFGYTEQEFEKGLHVLDMIVPEDRDRALRNLSRRYSDRAGLEGSKYSALRKDGSTFPALFYASFGEDGRGSPCLRGILIDLSEQERLAREKEKLEEQYIQAQKMEAVGRLAGGVAHDLNNMLSPIVGYSELMLDAMPPDDANREAANQILGASMRAKEMVKQLLAFSRKQALEIRPINLNQVLAGFESLLDRILRDDVRLELKLSRGVPNIMADAGQIEQVVMNLAVNAQDAMPDGGKITMEVGVTVLGQKDLPSHQLTAEGPYVVLTFSDTGHGMEAATLERLFEPFFTTKGQGKGTGLGLATVYGIVKQHNGSIHVSSEPGMGTVFNIYFPAATAVVKAEAPEPSRSGDFGGTESILIAEDNDAVRELADNILKKYGYQTLAVRGITECEEVLAQSRHFDLLLTDVVLQDGNGKEIFNKVRQRHPKIKVLYMSGYTDDVIVHHGVLEKDIAFIQKPFLTQELLVKVREALDQR